MTITEGEDGQTVEVTVESPSYSVRRLLDALDGIDSRDGEFYIEVAHGHRGGTATIVGPTGEAVLTIIMRGLPDEDEAAAEAEEREGERA